MQIFLKKPCFLLLCATIVFLSSCKGVPLNSGAGYKIRSITSQSGSAVANKPVWERTKYRIESSAPSFVTVKKGDTVYSLARKHNVSIREFIQANKLSAPFLLYSGQRLKLPPAAVHVVAKGDTVYSISRRYNIDRSQLVRLNNIQSYNIYPGQFLKLPGSIVLAKAASTKWHSASKTKSTSKPKTTVSKWKPKKKSSTVRLPSPPTRSNKKFAWPVRGTVTTKFGSAGGGRHNDGINIKVAEGTNVRASENGVIAYAGNELKGFGNLLLIKHADGWMTAYAHNKDFLVKKGQTVARGQVIATVGNTGNAKEAQLHFEIRKGTKAVNPLTYLE